MAAGLACLTKVMTDETYTQMEHLATRLADGQRKIIADLGIPACVTQVATLGGILFTPEEPTNFREAARCDAAKWGDYWFGMLNRSVIPMGSAWFEEWSISAAHTDEDIHRTLDATEKVLGEIYA
jgi:glutamate-1-semialdehyde 2,1-aminomutase